MLQTKYFCDGAVHQRCLTLYFLLMKYVLLSLFLVSTVVYAQTKNSLPNPILFVTQVPAVGFTSVTQTFSNHVPSINNAPRGGDLMILYPDGTSRNLTKEAGFGESAELQTQKAIAVRQPCVHWSGKKALFSMVVGAPTKIYEVAVNYWQIYEVQGLGQGEQAVVKKVEDQYPDYNNISPIYGSDDNIIFTSDLPITKKRYHYPPLDEYENAQVVSGLWKLNRKTGKHQLLEHSPSGSFYPIIDSYGRIIFTRWDHLQRDQQADLDRAGQPYGTFNYSSEDSLAQPLNSRAEIFPEPRTKANPDYDPQYSGHTFNQFFPWEINQDGTEEETVNHVGRHEWGGTYTEPSFPNDKNLRYIIQKSWVKNKSYLRGDSGPFQIMEDPNNPGKYYAAVSPEFSHETSGQIIRFSGGIGENPEDMLIEELTHRSTAGSVEEGKTPDPNHSGRYRNPLPLSNGELLAVHTFSTYVNKNLGSDQFPKVRYNFRLKSLRKATIDGKEYFVADKNITNGFTRAVRYFNGNNYEVTRNDTLWELDPVEVRERIIPPYKTQTPLSVYESDIFTEIGINEEQFRNWMSDNNLGLIVSRNVVTRDRNDDTQPYNLRVPGGVEHIANNGDVYNVEYLQIIQADLLRGQGGAGGYMTPRAGRRVLSQYLHDNKSVKNNIPLKDAPTGSVKIHSDGSIAAFIPANRALSWQLTEKSGRAIVRERYWVTMQSGEIRVCASCHAVNAKDQLGMSKPINKPEALRELLQYWKNNIVSGHTEGNDNNTESEISVTPHPIQQQFSIALSGKSDEIIREIKIFDMLNNEVLHQTYYTENDSGNEIPINLNNVSSGVYFLIVKTQSGKTLRRKLNISY